MKTKIKKVVIPMAVALVAIAGAFGSNLSGEKESALLTDRIGHTVTCQPTSIMCSTVQGPICTDANSNILYDWNGTSCPLPLKKKF